VRAIHLYVHGRGRGHGQRSKAVCDHLRRAGYAIRVFAGRRALDAFAADEAEPVDSVMPGTGWRTASLLTRRVTDAAKALRSDPPIAVLSDGDLPGVLAARLQRVPSIALGHGLIFSHARRPHELPTSPWRREAAKARIASIGTARQVAVSFTPLVPRVQTTTIARPTLRSKLAGTRTPGEQLLCYFRDANAEHVLRTLSDAGQPIRLFSEQDPRLPSVTWEPPHAERFADALMSARAVVSSAGSQLISECVALSIPQLALYDARDDEQRLNAALLQAHGLGTGCALRAFDEAAAMGFLTRLNQSSPQPKSERWGPDAGEAVEQALEAIVTHGE
jgi:UDP-N-acetylglucosamine--N-acetylmuramyl-(pentapeptide) pyrophosphoryl-undecaprenol N-acetylglucosamine transferase